MNSNLQSFNRQSERYAASRPLYPVELYTFLSSIVLDHRNVWDCACGNGQAAIGLVNNFDRVYATDISFNQLRNAYVHPKVTYASVASEHTFFPDAFFDMICVAQALHWFDLPLFFEEVDRVMKPGGIFAVIWYDAFTVEDTVDGIVTKVLREPIDNYWAEGNRMVMSGYNGVTFPFSGIETPPFKLVKNWNIHSLLEYLGTWSAVKRYETETGSCVIKRLEDALRPFWDEGKKKSVTMKIHCIVRRKMHVNGASGI